MDDPRPGTFLALQARLREAPALALMLDYDGTLVPLAPTPGEAAPDPPLLDLLAALAARPRTSVDVVSGRPRADLERWLGALPVGLHAEHGVWSRPPGEPWRPAIREPADWLPAVLSVLREVAAETPGAHVEHKTLGAAWHYRLADPRVTDLALPRLRARLRQVIAGRPVDLLDGHMVLEVRLRGIDKGTLIAPLLSARPEAVPVAIGDDATDEDLFAALPPRGIAIHVGPGATRAPHRLSGPGEVRTLLAGLLD